MNTHKTPLKVTGRSLTAACLIGAALTVAPAAAAAPDYVACSVRRLADNKIPKPYYLAGSPPSVSAEIVVECGPRNPDTADFRLTIWKRDSQGNFYRQAENFYHMVGNFASTIPMNVNGACREPGPADTVKWYHLEVHGVVYANGLRNENTVNSDDQVLPDC
ncbi:hypothetical protein F3087_40420 [Nocardia colli]|uniref:DUF3558 domain-containing protein n=1 Tax=Nocardia colli TaxID=2545717 RepID=A0A5N0DU34_9NOCA|nr:hypothetical protein [Nocardia colli]KAA8880588.1 hypothetical protein F3087_40420 [Nocardia colli]